MADDGIKNIARNRRARHEFEVLETFEAGIALVGPEVKSLRAGRANLGDAYGVVRGKNCWLEKLHISAYEPATRENPDPQRPRRLLLHGREIRKIHSKVAERGLTLIPLSLYFKHGLAKVELAMDGLFAFLLFVGALAAAARCSTYVLGGDLKYCNSNVSGSKPRGASAFGFLGSFALVGSAFFNCKCRCASRPSARPVPRRRPPTGAPYLSHAAANI